MSDVPENLDASHLIFGLAPDQTKDDTTELDTHYTAVLAQLDYKLDQAELLNDRIRRLPDPSAPASLRDLTAAARKRLRKERLQVDKDELLARRFVVNQVHKGLIV